jgi:aromatic ring-opening dioxygenase catalytic subunit (LigB family)
MAEVVGIFAASHVPLMVNRPETAPVDQRERVFGCYAELGRRLVATQPEALVVVSNEHLQNFFLDNLPSVCIGLAESYEGPAESWIKLPHRTQRGHAALAAHLFGHALEAGFDPSRSLDLKLDHGTLAPLHLAGVDPDLPLVPILLNNVEPPLPTMQRCLQWGEWLGQAIREYPAVERVAVLATGGLSHDIGTPNMGATDEAFDREFLRLLAEGDPREVARFAQKHVHEAGNGAEEVRNWVVARGAAGDAPLDVLVYDAIPAWYTGVAIAQWRV